MGRKAAIPRTKLGKMMQERRGEKTGREIAAAIGITPSAYYRMERGQGVPSLDLGARLAGWLGVEVEGVVGAAGEVIS